ncbi:SpaA isopeptide-forming pilin-related protein [Acutalibacter muris]|jgi:fimbrial isopeptide formation D2 family protein/LPXTG-motif cell wall-anchored protein|uniref:SpaA isopeptide-forming pilin-related protein n=1 Tax=Acutalibacter muris TaxID=1796620 RepID=UPI0026F3BE7D|nr:SpaA isopeptide-forming pilin-related protein [Acutalibacter muris]
MKNIKKLLALVLALAICAAFALPALATADEAGKPASEGPFILTMNTPQKGHTYEIYQLFKGNPAQDGENWILANVQYGSSGWKMESSENTEMTAAKAAEKISEFTTQELNEFVAGLDYENMTAVDDSLKNADDATTPLTWELEGGYYVIKDTTELVEGSDDVVSGIMVRVVGPTDVTPKPTKPTPDKDVDKTDPIVVGGPYDYNVGDMIPYVLKATVPVKDLGQFVKPGDDKEKSTYNLTFRDYMEEGLLYLPSEADFHVYYTVNDERNEIDKAYYNINNSPAATGEKTPTFEVSLDLFKIIGTDTNNWSQFIDGDNIVIEVTYKALLEKVEQVGTGVKNEVTLVYPNNPYDDDQTGSSVSPPVDVPVYSFTLEGTKVDGKDETKVLSGAEFQLKDSDGNVIKFVDVDGQFIRWSDTAFSGETPEGEGENATTYVYKVEGENEDGSPKYVMEGENPKKYTVVETVTSDENGKFNFGGLAAGTYTLVETKAPAGYNKLEKDITVEVIAKIDEETKKVTWTVAVNNEEQEGAAITVANNKGSTLPSTGGMGTTILYIVGAVLVVGAGVVLFTKRRMSN